MFIPQAKNKWRWRAFRMNRLLEREAGVV